MIAYGMADHKPSPDGAVGPGAVSVPRHKGGCGQCHQVAVNDEDRVYIDCDQCARALVAGHYGWSATPHGVPLTPDQMAQRELASRDAEDHQNAILRAMTDAFVSQMADFKAMQASAAKQPQSLQEQLAALSPKERAALFSSFAPAQALPAAEPEVPKTTTARAPRTPRAR